MYDTGKAREQISQQMVGWPLVGSHAVWKIHPIIFIKGAGRVVNTLILELWIHVLHKHQTAYYTKWHSWIN